MKKLMTLCITLLYYFNEMQIFNQLSFSKRTNKQISYNINYIATYHSNIFIIILSTYVPVIFCLFSYLTTSQKFLIVRAWHLINQSISQNGTLKQPNTYNYDTKDHLMTVPLLLKTWQGPAIGHTLTLVLNLGVGSRVIHLSLDYLPWRGSP